MNYKEKILDEVEKFQKEDHDNKADSFNDLSMLIKSILKKEEDRLVEFNVPDAQIHTALHDEFVRDLASFADQYFQNYKIEKEIVKKICNFIYLWIDDHIKYQDNFADAYIRTIKFTA